MTPDLTTTIELHGTLPILAVGGAVVGLFFGFFAQRSRFCLRAAVIDVWRGHFGERLSVWLLAFATAVVAVQALTLAGWLDASGARQLSNRGSLSGALVGGTLFGIGMVMTRGCASRLLILSANGNLRALLSGLVFAVTAQAALGGILEPWRTEVASCRPTHQRGNLPIRRSWRGGRRRARNNRHSRVSGGSGWRGCHGRDGAALLRVGVTPIEHNNAGDKE